MSGDLDGLITMSDDALEAHFERWRYQEHQRRMFDVAIAMVRDQARHVVLDGLADIAPVDICPSWCSVCNESCDECFLKVHPKVGLRVQYTSHCRLHG